MPPPSLILRADATSPMGTGHVRRCLALAQAWRDFAEDHRNCIFAMAHPAPALGRRLRAEGFEVVAVTASSGSMEDAAQVAALATKTNARWVVIDGYQFAAEYHRTLKDAGRKVLLVDYHGHTATYFSDLVLDQNLGADESFYVRRQRYTKLLLGPRYAMLRREFRPWRKWNREIAPAGRKVLITMGGSDPEGLSRRAIQALDFLQAGKLQATVVVGSSNPHAPKLRELAARFDDTVHLECDPNNLPALMACADLAVSAAGSTCWEMCMLGLPAIVIDAAENQRPIATELARRGIALHIPLEQATPARIADSLESLIASAQIRAQMSERGQELVDGYGADRVAAAMIARSMMMRPAAEKDSRLLWEWANEPTVRQVSFSSAAITWDEHGRWFSQKLRDPACLFLIFEDEGTPAGTVRIQRVTDADAEIAVTIAPPYRGRGLAAHLIERASEQAFANSPLQRMHALVKPENLASSTAFKNAGFFLGGRATVQACESLHYVRGREENGGLDTAIRSERAPELLRCR